MTLPTATRTILLLFSMSLTLITALFGQASQSPRTKRVPVYTSESDSIKLFTIENQLNAVRAAKPVDRKKYDSIITLYHEHHKAAITGYRTVYYPADDYVSLDSLRTMTDLSGVTRVSLHDPYLREIPAIIFDCKALESLELVNTPIHRLPKELNELGRLKTIRIYNPTAKRRIKLEKNRSVSTLLIRGNKSAKLPHSYRRFSGLELLDLSENSLQRFPNGARRNKALRHLILINNSITLEHRLKRHRHLEMLALQHNKISRVPRSIKKFRRLHKLSFNHNKISSVHKNLRHLRNLETLSFYTNELTEIPEGVYGLKNLREIDLFYNKIDKVDSRIGGLKNLKMLYLAHNVVTSLPGEIGVLGLLEGLYLGDNRLERLPSEVGQLKNLQRFWVNNNMLHELPESIYGLPNIVELNVSHNRLTRVDESIFDFPSLKIISLLNNPWDDDVRAFLRTRGTELRRRDVFVHLPE